jgi:uncharacterized damage-inducible protein DinB
MDSVKWFDRKFNFGFTEKIFPVLIDRLKSTPEKLYRKINEIPSEHLILRIEDRWSIKENIGHLIDLEPLGQRRLDDILKGREEMQAADLTNEKTAKADHNSRSREWLLQEFSVLRNQTILLLENLDNNDLLRSSRHPRLKIPMRTIDLFWFVAEHDDHHFERILHLQNQLRRHR